MELGDARRNAYRYILERLSRLPAEPGDAASAVWIPLDDLRRLKDGLAGPTPGLIAALSSLIGHEIDPEEFNAHLVTPFLARDPSDGQQEHTDAATE